MVSCYIHITFARIEVCTASKGSASCTDGGVNGWWHDWTVFFDLVVFVRIHCKQATQSFAGRTLSI